MKKGFGNSEVYKGVLENLHIALSVVKVSDLKRARR